MQTPETRSCPVCGGANDDRETCTFCGARLGAEEDRSASFLKERFADPPLPRPPPHPVVQPGREPQPGPPPREATIPAATAVPQAVSPVEAPRYAGFWIRVCAYLGDSIIIQLIIWLLFSVGLLGYTAGSGGSISLERFYGIYQAQWGSIAGLDFLVKLIYYTLFLGATGQTPAKKLFGLKVIRTDGAPVTYAQSLIRTLGYYINMLTLEIGFLWVAVDPRKQGLHDKIARTYEIRVDAAGQSEPRVPPVPASVP